MGAFKDLTGQRFGRLVVLRHEGRHKDKITWLCKCDCGNEAVVTTSDLRAGHTKSCGCLQRELSSKRHATHGLRNHPLYGVWYNMRSRCQDKRSDHFTLYGGRNISVCPEWDTNVLAFYQWAISHGWKSGLQIDRIDNNGNYTPENCRFVTRKENQNNRRNSRKVLVNGKVIPLADYAKMLNKPRGTVWHICHDNNLFV